MTSRSVAAAAVGVGAVTAVSRVLGFVRVLVVAAVLGATYLGNAFQAANSFSNALFELLAAGALSAVLVPTFVGFLDAGQDEDAEAVAGGVLGVALAALGAVTFVGVIFAPLLARLLTLGVPAAVADEQRDLIAFLLRFFVPQVLLYAVGTVSIAVLHAKRRFVVTAAAPIANTVVMVASLAALRVAYGGDLSLDLPAGARALLVVAGTGGVAGFVAVLYLACRRSGFALRPRLPRGDDRVWRALAHSGWGIVLHTGAGLLLAAAIVAGAEVEGAVVAYQVGWVFFLAPYAVLAQPVQTAIFPELVGEVGDRAAFAASIRWALERVALVIVPATAAMVALAAPAMRVVAFGEAGEAAGLLAAAVASLAVGLLPYSTFLLLARARYVLGDTRTPGVIALAGAVVGVAVMVVGALVTTGAARVAVLGAGHTVAYAVAAGLLARRLRSELPAPLTPGGLGRIVAIGVATGAAAWVAAAAVIPADPSRLTEALAVVALGLAGACLVVGGYRALGVLDGLTRRPGPT